MASTPVALCDRLDVHSEHEWYWDKVLRRQCPGRTTAKKRSRRVGHKRGNGVGGQDT